MLKVFLEQIRGDAPGKLYTIPRGTTKIGRRDADIEITSKRISSAHAELHYSGTRVFILDRNSTNGTFVNGKRVNRLALKNGDIIAFGGAAGKASAVFKLNIEGESKRVVVILKRSIRSPYKYLYMLLGLAMLLFFVWLLIPVQDYSSLQEGKRPWKDAEQLLAVSFYSGVKMTLAMGDTVYLPEDSKWKSNVRYERIEEAGAFESRLYSVDLRNDATLPKGSKKVVRANVTIQRFRGDFIGSIDEEKIKNFRWHETTFLKDNKIDEQFKYSNSEIGIWQWVVWRGDERFNLYATCITPRGRILLQASAFDINILKRFFRYVASTYKEGR